MTELAISSVGPPHPLHADRVIALMTRHLVDRARHIRDALKDIAFNANDGSPRAQQRLAQRLGRAGTVLGHQTVCAGLSPGKRGRYTIRMLFWSGWDKARDREIGVDDPLPSRPWLCLWYTEIVGRGRSRVDWQRAPLCYISTHVLSRMAQRYDMRTLDQMLFTITKIALGVLELVQSKGIEESLNPPPNGWHIGLDGGAELVLCKHDEKQVLVAVTAI